MPLTRHQRVSAGASQLLLPWVDELLAEAQLELATLDALAVGVGRRFAESGGMAFC